MTSFKSIPKIKQILNLWSKRVRQLILHLRLWQWAAVHDSNFWQFEIGMTKIIRLIPKVRYIGEIFALEISVLKPQFYLFEPDYSTLEFLRSHKLSWKDLHGESYFSTHESRQVRNHKI